MCPANERRCYIVTPSLIGWPHTQNDPWILEEAQRWSSPGFITLHGLDPWIKAQLSTILLLRLTGWCSIHLRVISLELVEVLKISLCKMILKTTHLTNWPLGNLNVILDIFKWILVVDGWGISCEIALILISLDFTDDQSTLVQVMTWCRQVTSHYLSQCWPRYLSPYGVTRP